MTTSRPFLSSLAITLAAITLMSAAPASADPPSRVARLGYASGAVSFSPAGESDWVQASINRPLTWGDRLWVDVDARAEVQVGGAQVRLAGGSAVSIVQIDERITQLELTEGVMLVRVRRLDPGEVFEIDTPNLAFTVRKPGEFRIEVDRDGEATTIVVRRGEGEVVGASRSYLVDARQSYRFAGYDLGDIYDLDVPRPDEFDRWVAQRDRYYDRSVSARYVSDDVVGYQDLDAYGTWRSNPTYGNVWYPTRVDAGWAPYRDGHWAWVDPWGWTWVDDAPWGFAVTHYGRWANVNNQWGWIPGPVQSRAVYAPALVVFVGGDNFQLSIGGGGNVGGIGWFPLGPREVFRPSYTVSRGYYERVNRSNTVINTTVINNTYNNTNVTNVVYANRQVPGAIVAVPTTTFVQSRPVRGNAVRVSREMVASAPMAAVAPVAPTQTSVRGAAAPGSKPPDRTLSRRVVARTAPPPAPASFAVQQQQLNANRGKPLETEARRALPPAAAATTPVVAVAPETRDARPTARPPSRGRDANADTASKPGERQVSPPSTPSERQASSPAKAGERQASSPSKPGERQSSTSPAVAAPAAQPAPRTAAPASPPGSNRQGDAADRRSPAAAVTPPPVADAPARAAQPVAPRTASPSPATPPGSNRQGDAADRRSPGAVVMPPPAARVPTAPAAEASSNAPQRTAAPGSKPEAATAQRTPPNGKDEREARSAAERATPPRAVPAQPLAPASTRAGPPGKSTARDAQDLADEAERQQKGRDNAKRAQDQKARDEADRGRDDKPR